jgi:hypothetical protein
MRFHLRLVLLALSLWLPMTTGGCQQRPATLAPEVAKRKSLPAEVKQILDSAQQLELFSIGTPLTGSPALTDTFQACTLRGKATINEISERKELLNSLYKGIQESADLFRAWLCFEGYVQQRNRRVAYLL